MNGFYAIAWATVLLPLAGGLVSFIAETPRRAAQICAVFTGLSLLVALTVLGYRVGHYRASAAPDESLITYLTIRPGQSQGLFPADLHPQVGVRVDNLSVAFMALIAFLSAAVQWQATVVIRGDAAYRRFFWAGSLMTTGLLAAAASPSLFQTWLALGMISAASLILGLHWWQRQGMAGRARRAFLVLVAADLSFLLGLVILISKLGSFLGSQTPPPSQDVADAYSYQLLARAWDATRAGSVSGAGTRTLVALAVLFVVAAMVHSAQAPVTAWLSGLIEAPLPVLAMLSISLLSGVMVIARVYPLLLDTPHLQSVIALAASGSAVVFGGLCLVSRDIYRVAVLSVVTQLALAITALGTGGYSSGLLLAFTAAPLGVLLFVVAGGLVRSYRTRDILEMGGAWQRMPRTSLALAVWAGGIGGLGLTGYDVVSAVFRNRFPNGGHVAGWVQVSVAILVVVALLMIATCAFRILFTVCAGETVRRRGYPVERIVEAERRQRRIQATLAVASVAAILGGIPGVTGFDIGRTHVPGLTFSHWIFFGGIRQVLPFSPSALGVALAALLVGAALGRLVGTPERADLAARLGLLDRLQVGPRLRPVGQAASAGTGMVGVLDQSLLEPLLDTPGEGIAIVAGRLGRLRARRLSVGLAAMLIVALLLAGVSVLAAAGHLPVHTT